MMEELETARKNQRLINAYRELFKSKAGELVLEDLRKRFGVNMPAFLPKKGGGYDPLWAAVRDGQRQVIIHIEHQISLPAQGDGNVEKPQARIIK